MEHIIVHLITFVCITLCFSGSPSGSTDPPPTAAVSAKHWLQIPQSQRQAAKPTGSSVSGYDDTSSDNSTADATDPSAAGPEPAAAPGSPPAATGPHVTAAAAPRVLQEAAGTTPPTAPPAAAAAAASCRKQVQQRGDWAKDEPLSPFNAGVGPAVGLPAAAPAGPAGPATASAQPPEAGSTEHPAWTDQPAPALAHSGSVHRSTLL